ncbi:NlpC/P60 family protein [Streptomyces sp. NPDC058220]|uniref:C40 family peptidase n=1 Tax=Streptomyces sp. NPDC058220 TaxID=3346387 RepID=UPI0036E3BCAD
MTHLTDRTRRTPQPATKAGAAREQPLATRARHAVRAPWTQALKPVSWARTATVLGLLFLVSLLVGSVIGVYGPATSASPPARPPVTLTPPEAPGGETPQISDGEAPEAPTAVPGPKPTKNPAAAAEKPTSTTKPTKAARAGKKIVLRHGDTLFALAQRHGTSVRTLQQLNGLGTSTLIYAGDTLRVPAPSPTAAGAATPPRGTPPPAADRATSAPRAVTDYARAQLGKPYIWGGVGPRGFDCSGLVMRAWQAGGVSLPRTTFSQIHAGTATTRAGLVPGDLVLSNGGGHVGLYIGDGRVIHAPRPGATVTSAPLPPPSQVVGYRHIRR